MESDWSVAVSSEDPVIGTDWAPAPGAAPWRDLRLADPVLQRSRIASLPEAVSSPALARALHRLNAPGGVLRTVKCDRWVLSRQELEEHALLLDVPAGAHGTGSYIDVLMDHPIPRADFLLHEEWARTVARRASAVELGDARTEMVVRPALEEGCWGFGLSAYCYGMGADAGAGEAAWAAALDAMVPLLAEAAEGLVPPADAFADEGPCDPPKGPL
jgi:hypothetical protein